MRKVTITALALLLASIAANLWTLKRLSALYSADSLAGVLAYKSENEISAYRSLKAGEISHAMSYIEIDIPMQFLRLGYLSKSEQLSPEAHEMVKRTMRKIDKLMHDYPAILPVSPEVILTPPGDPLLPRSLRLREQVQQLRNEVLQSNEND